LCLGVLYYFLLLLVLLLIISVFGGFVPVSVIIGVVTNHICVWGFCTSFCYYGFVFVLSLYCIAIVAKCIFDNLLYFIDFCFVCLDNSTMYIICVVCIDNFKLSRIWLSC